MVSQGYAPLTAPIFGTYIQGSGWNIAWSQLGFEAIMESDLLHYLRDAFLELFRNKGDLSQEDKSPE